MKKLKNIQTLLFDFGGTIDTDGIHWSEKFWEYYHKFAIPISKLIYEEAYRKGEPRVEEVISSEDSFRKTLNTQVYFQFDYLFNNNILAKCEYENYIEKISDACYGSVCEKISKFSEMLKYFSDNYSLALVSNFYGNISTVLKEFDIEKYFSSIVDSSQVGISKPNPEIFRIAITKLNEQPKNCVVIGDSYSRDIEPAKKLGCTTIWLDGKSWSRPIDTSCADFTINSVIEIKRLLSMAELL